MTFVPRRTLNNRVQQGKNILIVHSILLLLTSLFLFLFNYDLFKLKMYLRLLLFLFTLNMIVQYVLSLVCTYCLIIVS